MCLRSHADLLLFPIYFLLKKNELTRFLMLISYYFIIYKLLYYIKNYPSKQQLQAVVLSARYTKMFSTSILMMLTQIRNNLSQVPNDYL